MVTAIIGVTFGVVFWVWNLAWAAVDPAFAVVPAAKDLLYAVWLVPAVLAPYIVRKPGAAVFAEVVAAGLSAMLGSQWGVGRADLRARPGRWGPRSCSRSRPYRALDVPGARGRRPSGRPPRPGSTTGRSTTPTSRSRCSWSAGLMMAISAVVIVAGGSVVLVRALRQAGVLEGFPTDA